MADLQEYKCPCCGGALEFNSTVQKMKCPFCDSEFELSEIPGTDTAAETGSEEEKQEWTEGASEGMRVYVCKSCGGEIVGDASTAATSCPFCGNPIVMTNNFAGMLKPDLIIPFKLDKQAAKNALQKHFQGKKLLPAIFKDENHIDEIKGVYVPFWLFDADSDADMDFETTRVRRWSDSNFDYRETTYYRVRRAGGVGFDNVPVKGTTKMTAELMESIEPFDLNEAVEFRNAYLAGYVADKYDISSEECQDRIQERIKASTESELTRTVTGYDTVMLARSTVNANPGKAKYALYPVWLLNTTWNGNQYTFAMNGQTGKFVGDLPMDKGAYWKWFGIIGGIGAAATLLIGLLTSLL